MMGAESVEYHRATVLGRADDYPGMAMAYYASRGETPLAWGGSGAGALGLSGPVTAGAYDAVFGVGGARDPGLLSRRGPSGAHQGERRWDILVGPALARLNGEVASAEAKVAQLTAALQRYRARAGEPARRWLEAQRSAGGLASGLDAYRDQLDGLARPIRSPAAVNAAALARPSPAYGLITDAEHGPSL